MEFKYIDGSTSKWFCNFTKSRRANAFTDLSPLKRFRIYEVVWNRLLQDLFFAKYNRQQWSNMATKFTWKLLEILCQIFEEFAFIFLLYDKCNVILWKCYIEETYIIFICNCDEHV